MRRAVSLLFFFLYACGGRLGTFDESTSSSPSPNDLPPRADTKPPVPPPPGPRPPIVTATSCSEWPAMFKVNGCSPSSIQLTDDSTMLLALSPETSSCSLSLRQDGQPLGKFISPALLWFRDRKACKGSLCSGFDVLHGNVEANGTTSVYGYETLILGKARVYGTTAGTLDATACSPFGCFEDFPVDAPFTMTVDLGTRNDEATCRSLDITFQYTTARIVEVLEVRDNR